MKRSMWFVVAGLVVAILLYLQFFAGPKHLFKTGCKPYDRFLLYNFEAEVVNKFESGDTKVLTLVTFDSTPTTLDLSLEKNGLFEKITIGDTLIKKTQSLNIFIQNFDKQVDFTCTFECD